MTPRLPQKYSELEERRTEFVIDFSQPTTKGVRLAEPFQVFGFDGVLTGVYDGQKLISYEWAYDSTANWILPHAPTLTPSTPRHSEELFKKLVDSLAKLGVASEGWKLSQHTHSWPNGTRLTYDTITKAVYLDRSVLREVDFWFNRPFAFDSTYYTAPFDTIWERKNQQPFVNDTVIPWLSAKSRTDIDTFKARVVRDTLFGIPGQMYLSEYSDYGKVLLWMAVPAINQERTLPERVFERTTEILGEPYEDTDDITRWTRGDSLIISLRFAPGVFAIFRSPRFSD